MQIEITLEAQNNDIKFPVREKQKVLQSTTCQK